MTRTRYYLFVSIKIKWNLFEGFPIPRHLWHSVLTGQKQFCLNPFSPLQSFLKFCFSAGWIIIETGGDVECALQPQHPRLLLLRLADPREAQGDKNWCLEDLMAKVMLLLKSSFFDSTNHSILVQGKDRDGWFSEMYHSNGWDRDFPISKTCKSFSVKCFTV